jgi:hypothetical protein
MPVDVTVAALAAEAAVLAVLVVGVVAAGVVVGEVLLEMTELMVRVSFQLTGLSACLAQT